MISKILKILSLQPGISKVLSITRTCFSHSRPGTVKKCMNVITKICLYEVLQSYRAQFFLLLAFSKKVGFPEGQNMNGNLMIIAALLHFVVCRTRLLLLFFLSNLLFPFLERDEKFLCFSS